MENDAIPLPFPEERGSETVWSAFLPFETEEYVFHFLLENFLHLGGSSARKVAYRNTPKFIAHIRLGRTFFLAGGITDPLARPMLYYYGMISLSKALLLLVQPGYPAGVAQLSHGVTARKLKKMPYQWLEDEVKIQKEGLIPSLLSHHQIGIPTGKIKIKTLIRPLLLIPQMAPLYDAMIKTKKLRETPYASEPDKIDLPEYIRHLLILYHLGMLSRYEGEIWLDLNAGFPMERLLIIEILRQSAFRFPALIYREISSRPLT